MRSIALDISLRTTAGSRDGIASGERPKKLRARSFRTCQDNKCCLPSFSLFEDSPRLMNLLTSGQLSSESEETV